MPKASDLSPDSRFVALFVGRSGSGKTVAEASFPKPIEFMDFDGRIRGLLGAPWIDRSEITYTYYPPKMDGLIPALNKKLEGMMTMASVGQPLPKTFVTDSITNQNYAFICQSIGLTHTGSNKAGDKKGRFIGPIAMAGIEDYGLEAQAAYDYMAFMKSLPFQNIIVSAHYIDRFGKDPASDSEYAPSVLIGKKLSIRDKISENIQTHFDHIFEFERKVVNGHEKFYVLFRGDLARTSYEKLPEGQIDITGKNFYEVMMGYLK